jgi:hypothetical protein
MTSSQKEVGYSHICIECTTAYQFVAADGLDTSEVSCVDPINTVDAAFLSCTIASNIDLLSASLKQVEPAHLQAGFVSLVVPNCLLCIL